MFAVMPGGIVKTYEKPVFSIVSEFCNHLNKDKKDHCEIQNDFI